MRRSLVLAILSVASAAVSSPTLANGASFVVDNPRYHLEVAITEKLLSDDAEFSQSHSGNYVFVTSGEIQTDAIANAAACTGVRPRFGQTKVTVSGFKVSVYAAYYGPYRTRTEALDVKSAVMSCVDDAYVASGVIQRF